MFTCDFQPDSLSARLLSIVRVLCVNRVRPYCIFQTNSEAVALSIALQAGAEGSDLLRGGLTHTTLSAYWRPAGRGRVMNTWEVRCSRCSRSVKHICGFLSLHLKPVKSHEVLPSCTAYGYFGVITIPGSTDPRGVVRLPCKDAVVFMVTLDTITRHHEPVHHVTLVQRIPAVWLLECANSQLSSLKS